MKANSGKGYTFLQIGDDEEDKVLAYNYYKKKKSETSKQYHSVLNDKLEKILIYNWKGQRSGFSKVVADEVSGKENGYKIYDLEKQIPKLQQKTAELLESGQLEGDIPEPPEEGSTAADWWDYLAELE